MTPQLALLTGPGAGDVAAVLRAATPAADPRQGASCDPWWDEVRDYRSGPKHIELAARGLSEGFRPQSTYYDTEKAIRSLPGGEAWLVGLVLPECPIYCCYTNGMRHDRASIDLIDPDFTCEPCRKECGLPDRLAILAPDPPKLLIERVRAWGGDCWHLRSYDDGWCYITFEDGGSIRQVSWPEAVRAALGVS